MLCLRSTSLPVWVTDSDGKYGFFFSLSILVVARVLPPPQGAFTNGVSWQIYILATCRFGEVVLDSLATFRPPGIVALQSLLRPYRPPQSTVDSTAYVVVVFQAPTWFKLYREGWLELASTPLSTVSGKNRSSKTHFQ